MKQLLTFLLPLVLIYGYPIIIAIVMAGETGLPVPVTYTLVAAGSFTTDGTLSLNILIPLIALTAIVGDSIGYWVGRKVATSLLKKYVSHVGIQDKQMRSMNRFLKRWGALCIFLTRWLFTPLGVPVNFIAGINNYPFMKFVLVAALGEFLWATIYTYLGYFFGTNWIAFIDYINAAPYIALAAFIIIISLITVFRMRHHLRR